MSFMERGKICKCLFCLIYVVARRVLRAFPESLCAIVMTCIPGIMKGLTYLRILRYFRFLL